MLGSTIKITGPTYITLLAEGIDLLGICYDAGIIPFFFCSVQLTVSLECTL
jgi:hypothetical protein